MGLLSRLLGGASARASKATGVPPRDPVLAAWWSAGSGTASGATVTADTALRVGTVYACIKVLAETIASLPLVVYRRQPSGKVRDDGHPLWPLLHDAPNRLQTSFEWRETMVAHAALRGVGYSRVVERNDGVATALEPLHPDRVTSFLAPNGEIAYAYQPQTGPREILLDREVLRIPGLSDDGIRPLSPIGLHRETIGLSMASQEYLARFFGNNAAPKGGIKVPQPLSDQAVTALRESWERRHKGLENQHRLAILDGGMDWVALGVSNEDAQYLELLQFQVTDIARLYRMPPHMIGDLSRATNSNIEQQSIEFVQYVILPWTRRIEDRLNRTLLSAEGRRTHFIGFEIKGLLRGDQAARSQFYRELFHIGAISQNEIRRAEDMAEIEDGDTYFVPLNLAPSDQAMAVLLKNGPQQPKAKETGRNDG